jgi:DNA-binding LytR/AlgR family response regulator
MAVENDRPFQRPSLSSFLYYLSCENDQPASNQNYSGCMRKMTCVVIEDEPLSAGILDDYIREVSFLEPAVLFRDAVSALDYLKVTPVDLYFVDLHLPKLKGFEFLRTFRLTGQVIITTAHHEFALEGYELGVVDYLLKPVSFERFLKAVHKAREFFNYKMKAELNQAAGPAPGKSLYFKSGPSLYKIDADDITHLEKKGNYFDLFTRSGKKIMVRLNFADILEKLPAEEFCRVHKSFIVGMRHIEIIERNYILVNKHRIPVSTSFKEKFMKIV